MSIYLTQSDFDTARQPYRDTYAKIELLNFQFLTVESLEGLVTTLSVNINADSDIRRTCNVTFVVKDSSFNTVNEANYMDKLSLRLRENRQSFNDELHKYEQLCAYKTMRSNGLNIVLA